MYRGFESRLGPSNVTPFSRASEEAEWHEDAENPAAARKANDQARELMVVADIVLAEEAVLSGTLCSWLALVSHAQAARTPAVLSGKIRQGRLDGPKALNRSAAVKSVRARVGLHVENS
jgi:hypothetical protein